MTMFLTFSNLSSTLLNMVLSNWYLLLHIWSLSFTFLLLVYSKGQTDSIYFDFCNDFNIIQHALLLHKLHNYGFPSSYFSWFCNYLTNRQFCVSFSGVLPSLFVVQSHVPQGSDFGPLLCNIFINALCDLINHCLLFVDDLRVYQSIK
jgi:hypothetical protein